MVFNRVANGQLTLVQAIETGGKGKPAGRRLRHRLARSSTPRARSTSATTATASRGVRRQRGQRHRHLVPRDGPRPEARRPEALRRQTCRRAWPAQHGNLLYVLNVATERSTASFRRLQRLPPIACVLTADRRARLANDVPSQASVARATIGFDERGRASWRSPSASRPAQPPQGTVIIVVYKVDSNGKAGAAVVTPRRPTASRSASRSTTSHDHPVRDQRARPMQRTVPELRCRPTDSWSDADAGDPIDTESSAASCRAGSWSRTTAGSPTWSTRAPGRRRCRDVRRSEPNGALPRSSTGTSAATRASSSGPIRR